MSRAKTGVARITEILHTELPHEERWQHYQQGKKCTHPELLELVNEHPLFRLSGVQCEHFAYVKNASGDLARQGWIGGCYRGAHHQQRTPRALLDSALESVWQDLKKVVDVVNADCERCAVCGSPFDAVHDVDHIEPQHKDIKQEVFDAIVGSSADWWGYRFQHGVANSFRQYIEHHPLAPLQHYRALTMAGQYQLLHKACHGKVTSARRSAKTASASTLSTL